MEVVAEPNGELRVDDQMQMTRFEISLKDERFVAASYFQICLPIGGIFQLFTYLSYWETFFFLQGTETTLDRWWRGVAATAARTTRGRTFTTCS